MDVLLHGGTLLATVLVFRDKIREILISFFYKDSPFHEDSIAWFKWLLLGLIPTGIIGVVFKTPLESLFASPLLVSAMLLVTGLILFSTRFAGESETGVQKMKAWQAVAIGVVQGIAIIPGISRSGSTIAIALLIGVSRVTAGEFSFLLSIPSILGAILLKSLDVMKAGVMPVWPPMIAGVLVAFAVGCFALTILLKFVRTGKLHYFSYYCFAIGILGIIKFWN